MNNEKVKFLLNWNHFTEHLSACMTKLMTDSSYSDIIIATGDKRMIYSHRFVLANSSKYFQKLLKHMNNEKGIKLVVALPEIKYDIFKILMNYMYKGETQVPHELLPSVIKAGQLLEINGLVNLNESDNRSHDNTSNRNTTNEDGHSRSSSYNSDHDKRVSSTLREKIQKRKAATVTKSKSLFHNEKKTRSPSNDLKSRDDNEKLEKEKENQDKQEKSTRYKNSSKEKKNCNPMPTKRKIPAAERKGSSTELTASQIENCLPKKIQKISDSSSECHTVKIKSEKESSSSPLKENESQDIQEVVENITIKVEAPDIEEDSIYNELRCEYCHEVYTNPTEWVRHMSEQHEDRGYQTHKDDKTTDKNTVMTCVVCSCKCYSAAEWAKHLRVWHTERELALANLGVRTRAKKKSTKDK